MISNDSPVERPLRPLFVNSGLGFGGAETQLINVVKELSRRGHSPHIYLLTRAAPRLSELDGYGVPIAIDEKRSKLDFKVISRLRKYIVENRIEIVHSMLFDSNIYARLATVGMNIPVINGERSSDYQLSTSQKFAHALTRWRVDGLIANSHAGREFAQSLYGLPADRTHVTWNGIDLGAVDRACEAIGTDYRAEFFGSGTVKVAVFVGSINPTKDHALALTVANALIDADPTWRVIFIGAKFDGSQTEYVNSDVTTSEKLAGEVERQHQSLEHREKILFVGRREDAIEIISRSDVLFSTSFREGFPNVVLEAMAVGTPVVSTSYSDIKLILDNNGYVVESRKPEEMVRAIIDAERNKRSMGRNSRRWVEDNGTIEKSADAVLEVYKKYTKDLSH